MKPVKYSDVLLDDPGFEKRLKRWSELIDARIKKGRPTSDSVTSRLWEMLSKTGR